MKRFVALLLVVAMVFCLAACNNKNKGDATTPTDETPTTTTKPMNADYSNPQYNPLTGAFDLDGTGNRPVGVMVANDSSTRNKQAGLDKADLYVEIETEGSIPRIMAVFANANRLPDKIGPVRSARYSFVSTAHAMDVVYCHFSGHRTVQSLLKTGYLDRLDAASSCLGGRDKNGNALTYTPEQAANYKPTYWRDTQLRQEMDYVHSAATGKDKIVAAIENKGFSTSLSKNLPFNFGDKVGDTVANKVQMRVTPSTTTSFVYNSETKLYTKQYGALDNATTHTSLEGNAITATNIVVLYAPKYFGSQYSKKETANFNFVENGTGIGYIVSNGTAREIRYTRTEDEICFIEMDGSTALLAKGKTYMCLVDETQKDKLVFAE